MSKPPTDINTEEQRFLTVKPKIIPNYNVNRAVLHQESLILQTSYTARNKTIRYALRQCWSQWSFVSFLRATLPLVQWLPKYSIQQNLLGDIISGFTVGIVHIPHGMAYGLLAGLTPNNGLYMAIYPCLVYMVFGTSRHISIGTWAVASLMTLKVVEEQVSHETHKTNIKDAHNIITPVEVATTLTFAVGLLLLGMYMLRLGIISTLLSEPLINGFTTGAACHVVSSQLKDVFGLQIPRYKSAFKIIWTIYDLCRLLPQTNVATLIFCLCIMIFMTICNELVKPNLKKLCRVPLPAELLAVTGGTLVSMFMNVEGRWGVTVIGEIPKGLPPPVLPRFTLVPKLMVDAIAIALVTYSIIMSMSLLFARKHNYEIDANQELFAMGLANIVSSFFSCIPLACSMSRSLIQEQAGGSTQLVTLISASVILIILFWAGAFFSYLPRCVLAGIIIVALKSMFLQAKELKKYAKHEKLEVLQWLITFLIVVIIDIDYGLMAGILVSILNLYMVGLRPYSCLLAHIPNTPAIYVDMYNHRAAVEVSEIKIFRYYGSINFATASHYRKALYGAIGFPTLSLNTRKSINSDGDSMANNYTMNSFHFLILDLSMLGHLDFAGCQILSTIKFDLEKQNIRLLLATPADRVYDKLVHAMNLGAGPFEIFATLHDAVEYANACRMA